jgi:RNA polymerase sigma factor (sigma-70 family)
MTDAARAGVDAKGRRNDAASLAVSYRDPLVRYFTRRGLTPDVAEDCAQEVFVRIARADFAHVENAEAYLFTIASSVMIDRARWGKARREDRHETIDNLVLISTEAGPARAFETRQALERLAVVLDELPERTREVFLLNRMDGLSYTQLAARFGVNVSSIEKRMTRALVHLRKRYSSDD